MFRPDEVASTCALIVTNVSNAASRVALLWRLWWAVIPYRRLPPIDGLSGWFVLRTMIGRYRRATLLACRLTNGSTPARRRGTRWPEGGKGRMSLLLKVLDLVRRIPGHRPARLRVASEQHAGDAPCLHGAGLP